MTAGDSRLVFMNSSLERLCANKIENGPRGFSWRLLRDVVPDDWNHAPLVWPCKEPCLRVGRPRAIDAIAAALQHNRRHRDLRLGCEEALQRVERRIAGDITETVTIGMDDHIHEIGIVERYG